jgi:predicted anti-sigma-YlaC factor YlaD
MECVEAHELMQRYLDGDPAALDRPDLAAHLALCPDCREWYAAAQSLLDGLRHLTPPQPLAGFAGRVCRQVVAERRRAARARRLLAMSAVAASLLLVGAILYLGSPREHPGNNIAQRRGLQPGAGPPSLQRSLEEAGLAVVALTRRTADETVNETKLLLPVSLPQAAVADARELEQALQPPAQSLREIQEGMSAGLEPVATSARRAVGLFFNGRQWAATGGR